MEATTCPLIEEWIKNYVVCLYVYKHTTSYIHIHVYTYTHNGILLSHKKNKIMPFAATWMEIILLNDVVKDKNMISLICGILKNDTNEHIYKEETDSHRKQTYDYQRGEVKEGIN